MFLLDTNVFVAAARQYYSPDIAPTFWTWLRDEHDKGNLASIVAVRQELDDGDPKIGPGHLKRWAAALPDSFWLKASNETAASMAELSTWARDSDRNYWDAAKDEFFRSADYKLVAQAHAAGHSVVTFELPSPDSKKRVLIPDACAAVQVPYREPFSIYRELGLRFW